MRRSRADVAADCSAYILVADGISGNTNGVAACALHQHPVIAGPRLAPWEADVRVFRSIGCSIAVFRCRNADIRQFRCIILLLETSWTK